MRDANELYLLGESMYLMHSLAGQLTLEGGRASFAPENLLHESLELVVADATRLSGLDLGEHLS